jgi:hypothetical protein
VCEAPGCLPQRSDHVEPSHSKRPGERDSLERLRWKVSLLRVELATLATSHDVLGISDHCGLVEAFQEHAPEDRSGGHVVAAGPHVDVLH